MIGKVLPRLGIVFGFLALTACYANFRSESYDSPATMPRIAGLELGLGIRQAHHAAGLIYRDDGPYRMNLRLEGKSGIYKSAIVHRLVVRDRSNGEAWAIVSAPVVIHFQEDGSPRSCLAQKLFEPSFQPVFSETKVLEAEIDISLKAEGNAVVRKTMTIPFKADSHEFKGFLTFEDLMSV